MSKVIIHIKKVTFKKIVELLKKENPNSTFIVSQGKVSVDNQKINQINYNNTLELENVLKRNQELLEKNFGFKKEKINYIKSPSPYKSGVLYYTYFDKDTSTFGYDKDSSIGKNFTNLLQFQKQLKKIKNYYAFKWYYPRNDQLDGDYIYLNKKTGEWNVEKQDLNSVLFKFT